VKIFSRLLPSSFEPLKLAVLVLCAWAALLGSCSQRPITVRLHAMQTSGRVSFVCRGNDNASTGHKLDECPEYETGTRRLLALVTQTATNEVAVVDLYAQAIVDIDQTTPGYSFLRVGAQPGAIVTTPGGAATFVGVSGLTKNGIFALPTSCVMPPQGDEAARDLTTWAACHLSSAPGDISVVLDAHDDLGRPIDPALGNVARATCPNVNLQPVPPRIEDACPADLTREPGPVGRRKLLVALPAEHKLVLLDAQRLLDQAPGTFNECEPEATFALDQDAPTTPLAPILPDDLKPEPDTDTSACLMPSYPASDMSALPTPGGLAATGDRVYVADTARPVIHVLDVSDPCTDTELPPLLPYSYSTPERLVTTSRLAVSPLSPTNRQFVYAIDQNDQPAASIMVFDLARIAGDPDDDNLRTPVVFPNAARQRPDSSNPAPDRLRFNAPVRDVSFVMRDFPKPDPITGAGEFGIACDPIPTSSGPGTAYRPNSDFTDGARPVNLRGLFGFAMLTNGQVGVIDVEDFDKDCRRPVTSNMGSFEDLHGCHDDPISTPYAVNGGRTVSGESSCNIVEPHRARSAALSISSSANGLRAPTLRTFPQFSNLNSSVVGVDMQPHMLATDFDNPDPAVAGTLPAEVNVGAQLYAHCTREQLNARQPPCDGTAGPLVIDPTQPAVQNSLTLPLIEPRSYALDESPALSFEGRVFPDRTSGYLQVEPEASEAIVRDPDANFCGAGVEDSDTIRARGEALGIPAANLDAWAVAHADYVQISGDYPAASDRYWVRGHGSECAELINPSKPNPSDRDACVSKFGAFDNPAGLSKARDLSILRAYAGQLDVTPRYCQAGDCAVTLAQMACCFPAGTGYTVRASHQWLLSGSGGLHDIAVGPSGRCEHTASCDRRKQHFGSRAFEVCDSSRPFDKDVDIDGECALTNPNVGCVTQQLPVLPGDQASACIFENLTSRFVVYRGAQPSALGMTFSWQTTGGFVPQTMSLIPQSSSVSPQSLGYLPELGYLAVVDASTLGLLLFDLNSLGVVLPSPYY
jgi:hypothetical protein